MTTKRKPPTYEELEQQVDRLLNEIQQMEEEIESYKDDLHNLTLELVECQKGA